MLRSQFELGHSVRVLFSLLGAFSMLQGELSVPSFKSIAEAQASGGQNRVYQGPPFGRNHSSVADAGVAAQVVTWIAARERSHGDLF